MTVLEGQLGLFEGEKKPLRSESTETPSPSGQPLAHKVRPADLESFFGHEKVFKKYPNLSRGEISSMILFGPPGVGKTTLAGILSRMSGRECYLFNAVLNGIPDLKKVISRIEESKEMFGKDSVLFIDEIHRFNKAQQDALLPYVEKGTFLLIGATTENPRRGLNNALLSRVQLVELGPLESSDLEKIIAHAAGQSGWKMDLDAIETLADLSYGDARKALNALEQAAKQSETIDRELIKKVMLENARLYDRDGNRHYDVISAFIKSMRGSDPDAALIWLAVMLDGGEDPVFIARRLVIFASEDVGNADPTALQLAVNALQAVQNIGMPEARITLGQATTYLASTLKSNAAYKAMDAALEYVRNRQTLDVPDHLKNFPPKDAEPYKYPHAYEGSWVAQKYTKEKTPKFYEPKDWGREKWIKERLESLHKN